MQLHTQVAPVVRTLFWVRCFLATLAVLVVLFDCGTRITEPEIAKRLMAQLGYPENSPSGTGTLALVVFILLARFLARQLIAQVG
jgi:hypothetical protein